MKFYNTSLETFKTMVDCKVFVFYPREFTEVPHHLKDFVLEKVKPYGVFAVEENMTPEQLQAAKYNALKEYLKGALRIRIENYAKQRDMFQKMGVSLSPERAEQRALQWKKEIHKILELNSPLEEELSFLDNDARKALGIEVPNAKEVKDKLESIPQDIFSPEKMKHAKVEEITQTKRRKIESFEEVEIGK